MLETPVKPAVPQSEPWPAAPPDPTTRVVEAPPEPPFLAERSCHVCGFPLDADQAACLVCGSMVEDRDERVGLRRAALSSASALLLVGLAVGAAVAGLPHGKHVPKPPVPSLLGQAPRSIPPATSTTLPSGPSKSGGPPKLEPLPGQTASAKPPPPIETSHPSPAAGNNATASTSGGSSSNTGNGGTSSNSNNNGNGGQHHHHHTGPKIPDLYVATPVAAAYNWPIESHLVSALKTIDQEKTVWTSPAGKTNVGVFVHGENGPYTGIGVISGTPGYGLEVSYSKGTVRPTSSSDWKTVKTINTAVAKQRVSLTGAAQNAAYYLIRITRLPKGKASVTLAEIQLLQ